MKGNNNNCLIISYPNFERKTMSLHFYSIENSYIYAKTVYPD